MAEQNEINFILTCYPVVQSVKKVFAELHLLLTPVFINVPIFSLTLTGVSKMKQKADPNHVGGGVAQKL